MPARRCSWLFLCGTNAQFSQEAGVNVLRASNQGTRLLAEEVGALKSNARSKLYGEQRSCIAVLGAPRSCRYQQKRVLLEKGYTLAKNITYIIFVSEVISENLHFSYKKFSLGISFPKITYHVFVL